LGEPWRITVSLPSWGQGGMGEVHLDTVTKLRREVTIKILPPLFVAGAEHIINSNPFGSTQMEDGRRGPATTACGRYTLPYIEGLDAARRGGRSGTSPVTPHISPDSLEMPKPSANTAARAVRGRAWDRGAGATRPERCPNATPIRAQVRLENYFLSNTSMCNIG
jgi:hypothetical protein